MRQKDRQTKTESLCGLRRNQCDQIERFFDLLGNKFAYKSSQNILVIFSAILIKTTFCKNDLASFWTILIKIGQLFISSSGHTVRN